MIPVQGDVWRHTGSGTEWELVERHGVLWDIRCVKPAVGWDEGTTIEKLSLGPGKHWEFVRHHVPTPVERRRWR